MLLEIIERSVDTSEMSSYYKAECEVAVANAKKYLADRERDFDEARKTLNDVLEKMDARSAV